MTRPRSRSVPVLTLLAVSIVVAHGCARKPRGPSVVLGPKPASYAGERAHESEMVDNLRAWLENLSPQHGDTLKETGQLVFPYEELQRSDPAHARMLAEHARESEARITQDPSFEEFKARGFPAPDFTIQSVSFVAVRSADGKVVPGMYEFRIDYRVGQSNFILSEPLR